MDEIEPRRREPESTIRHALLLCLLFILRSLPRPGFVFRRQFQRISHGLLLILHAQRFVTRKAASGGFSHIAPDKPGAA